MLSTLNLHSAACQWILIKLGKKEKESLSSCTYWHWPPIWLLSLLGFAAYIPHLIWICMFLGPSLSLNSQTPKRTSVSCTGGQNLPHPCPSPLLLAVWTEKTCWSGGLGGGTGSPKSKPSQAHSKPRLPGFNSSPTRPGIMRPPHPST